MKGGGDQKRAQRRRKVCCAAVLVYLCAAGNLHPVMLYKQKISILHNQICLFYSRQHGCAHASCCHATTGNRLRFIATVARNAVADTGQPHWSEAGTRKNTFLTLFLFALSLSLSLSCRVYHLPSLGPFGGSFRMLTTARFMPTLVAHVYRDFSFVYVCISQCLSYAEMQTCKFLKCATC